MLDRNAQRAEAKAIETREKAIAKRRDGRCRWPEKHKCRGALEAAHIRDASLGGQMDASNLVTLCAWVHRSGPESIHGKQLAVQVETVDGAWGPLSFWRQLPEGIWQSPNVVQGSSFYLVRRETAPFQYERD